MKLDIFNINEFIKLNHCMKVTSAVALQPDGTPTLDGIFSEVIFGTTTDDQINRFGYVDLNCHVIHPAVYSIIKTRFRKIFKIILGKEYAVVRDRKILFVPADDPDGETGISFLYDHFDQIDWITEDEYVDEPSIDKKNRLKFFQLLSKDEFFVDKWLILPRYYRDYRDKDDLGNEINRVYKELINKTSGLKMKFSISIFADTIKLRIQDLVLLLYQMTMKPVTGKSTILAKGQMISTSSATNAGTSKTSLLRRHAMGKFIDYSASSVIVVSVLSKYNSYKDVPTKYGYSLVPLPSIVSMFKPFFVHHCSLILENYFNKFKANHRGVEFVSNQFSPANVEKLLDKFIKSPESKDTKIAIETTTSSEPYYFAIQEFKSQADAVADRNEYKRDFTLIDLVYQAAIEIVKDKACLITRYPITNNLNLFLSMISVASTEHTHNIWVKNEYDNTIFHYDTYPYVLDDEHPYKEKVPESYYELRRVLSISNAFIKQLGADYDGDMLYLRGLFTKEACTQAREIIFSKRNNFNANGGLARGLSLIARECTVSLYELTKD